MTHVGTAHLSEGKDSFWEESIKFGRGGAASYMLVSLFIQAGSCGSVLYWILCVQWAALWPWQEVPCMLGMMPLQTSPLSRDRCQPTRARLSLDNVTPITTNYVRRERPKRRQIWKHNVRGSLSAQGRCTEGRLKANSHVTCRVPAVLCSDSAVSFVKVHVVAWKIRTVNPTVYGSSAATTLYSRQHQWRAQEFCSGGVQQIQLRTERTGTWRR